MDRGSSTCCSFMIGGRLSGRRVRAFAVAMPRKRYMRKGRVEGALLVPRVCGLAAGFTQGWTRTEMTPGISVPPALLCCVSSLPGSTLVPVSPDPPEGGSPVPGRAARAPLCRLGPVSVPEHLRGRGRTTPRQPMRKRAPQWVGWASCMGAVGPQKGHQGLLPEKARNGGLLRYLPPVDLTDLKDSCPPQ